MPPRKMNFLERRALARARERLAPLMEEGEEVLEFDSGRINGRRAELIASDRAVFLRVAGSLSRTRYEEFADIEDLGPSWGIVFKTLVNQGELFFRAGRAPRKGLFEVLKERMDKLVLHDTTLPCPLGGEVRWRWRPAPDGSGDYFWQVDPDNVPDADGEEFQRWMRQTAPELSKQFGVKSRQPEER